MGRRASTLSEKKYEKFTATGNQKQSTRELSKMCLKCKEAKKISDFYKNTGWDALSNHDAWCKSCVSAHCTNKETLREYCWYNNRKWSDDFFDKSRDKAEYTQANNQEYVKASQAKRAKMLNEGACRAFFQTMNLASQYVFIENMSPDGEPRPFDPKSKDGTIVFGDSRAFESDDELTYSEDWNGKFTKQEVEFLDNYYSELDDGFVLDNKSIRDYARKVAKASLAVDIASNNFRRGAVTIKELKDALDMFDNLSKSANFAACKRKAGEQAGQGSFGELVMKIESTGKIETNYVKWEQDEVDKVIEELYHIVAAVGLDGGQ